MPILAWLTAISALTGLATAVWDALYSNQPLCP